MNLNSQKSDKPTGIKKFYYRDILIFLIPFLIFLIYLNVYNPGILTLDSFSQLHQIATNEFTNHHPFFHTFIEMLCLKVYASPLSVGILQILVFSTMWTIICRYHRDDSNGKSDVFFIQAIITLFICLIPINAIYSITLWKDVLFCYFLMFLCFLIKVMLDKNGKIDLKTVIILAITMAFVAQLRANGIYLIIPTLIILAIYLFRKNPSKKIGILLPALTVVLILLIASLNVAYNVEDNQKDFVFVKTSHMLADYDLHLNLNDADRDKIHKMINESKINKSYTIYSSDPIYWNANEKVFDDDKGGYIGLALSSSLQNPQRFLYYMFKSADIVWDVTRDNDWTGEVYYITDNGSNIEKAKTQYYASINSTPKEGYEDISDVNHNTGKYTLLNSFVNTAKTNMVLDTLFNSSALYMYLAIILLILMHVVFRSKDMYLVYLPNFLNIIIVFLSIPAQDNRYLYANQLVFYLLVIILINFIFYPRRKTAQDSSTSGFENAYPERKQYNVDDIYIDGNSEEDTAGRYLDGNTNYGFDELYSDEDNYILNEALETEEKYPQKEETLEEIKKFKDEIEK